jgi:CheY-like chemotaxis protein
MKKTLIVLSDAILLSVFKSWVFRSQKKDSLFLAKNGKEAIEIMQTQAIDFFATELNLAEIDGLELLAGFSFYYPSLKIAILTPPLSEKTEQKFSSLHSFYFVKKPESLKEFINLTSLLDVAIFQVKPLAEMVLSDFLELIEIQKKTCLLAIDTEIPQQKGIIYFELGILHDAVCGDLKAEFAVIEMLGWKHVKITFRTIDTKKFRKQIQTSLSTLVDGGAKAKAEIEADILALKTKKLDEQTLNLQEEVATKALAEFEAKATAEAKSKAAAEALAKAKSKAEAEAKAKSEAQSRVKAEAEAKAKSEAQIRVKAEAEAKAQSEAQSRVKAEAEAKTQSEAQSRVKAEAEAKAKSEAQSKAKAMDVRISKLELGTILGSLQQMDDYLASAIFNMTGSVLIKHNLSAYNVEAIGENAVSLIKCALDTFTGIGLGKCNFIQINCDDVIFEAVWVFEEQFVVAVLLKSTTKSTGLAKMNLIKISETIHDQLVLVA